MSQENVELVRRIYERFEATGEFVAELAAPGFIWDMSNLHGWPEEQVYQGADGARSFLDAWLDAWDEWELAVEELHDAGDRVVAVCRQRGRSKATGLPSEMTLAQVYTLRDGLQTRMDMYSDPAEALRAVGLAE